jgi:hypothetical protein
LHALVRSIDFSGFFAPCGFLDSPQVEKVATQAVAGHDWRSPEWPISAKQTGRRQHVLAMEGQPHVRSMSALPPIADIGTQSRNVRFVPEADIG